MEKNVNTKIARRLVEALTELAERLEALDTEETGISAGDAQLVRLAVDLLAGE